MTTYFLTYHYDDKNGRQDRFCQLAAASKSAAIKQLKELINNLTFNLVSIEELEEPTK